MHANQLALTHPGSRTSAPLDLVVPVQTIALTQGKLAAVRGCDMVSPVCFEYELDERPILRHCTFILRQLQFYIASFMIYGLRYDNAASSHSVSNPQH